MMTFTDAVKICFTKYVDFNGRAKRPEFWWFVLFCVVASLALEFVSGSVSALFSLATLVPSIAVGARRLHDINKTGWLQLLALIPILGWIYLIYLCAQPGDKDANQYGEVPES